ncbi:MAG TPA: hypothetical protein PKA28_15865 [Methylomusa anaerophila]|uniref:Uncharacterized protein n=1 Tax=Methylomusa anaerophila TaxID=1930071 RepID=A0A348AK92_9FIRM|nr:hypothetical protein [Methylomusa anaerophila]BBB91490.1 hypothetical protein MAMMFC1_02174 [Methylomusa anaerophila]HML89921.1 hypothetical protein [Methylomusa anaerophila]
MKKKMNMDEMQAEELSAAIDSLNMGLKPAAVSEEINNLIIVAGIIKQSYQQVQTKPDHTTALAERIAAGIEKKRKKRRKKFSIWAFAGGIGSIAAVLLAAALNLVPPLHQEHGLREDAPPDKVIAANDTQAPLPNPVYENTGQESVPGIPPSSLDDKPAPEQSGTVEKQADTSSKAPIRTFALPDSGAVPGNSNVSRVRLPGRKADAVTEEAGTGIVRQIYGKGTPREIIVTQLPPAGGGPVAASISREKTAKSQQNEATARNKVFTTINGIEVIVEGAVPEDELKKLAQTLVVEETPQPSPGKSQVEDVKK